MLDLLFEASSQTLLEVAADPKRLGAEIGFLSILHTWSSNLLSHYHIHAVVPAGGLSADHQRWIHTSHPLFLLPVPVLRTVFRKKFLAGLCQLYGKSLLNPGAVQPLRLRDPALLPELMMQKRWATRNGTSMPSLPSGDPSMSCATSAATPTRMAIIVQSPSHRLLRRRARQASAGGIMPTAANSAS